MRGAPERPTSHPRWRRALVALAALALVAVAACSSGSEAGGGFRLSEGQLTATTTSTLQINVEGFPTTVATAAVPLVEVYATRPGPDGTAPPHVDPPGDRPPLPRHGFAQAGAEKAESGWLFENPTYWGKPLVWVVTGADGDWLEVMVPARPNGQRGWVRASDVTLSQHDFHGQLDLSDFTFTVWDGDEVLVETLVVTGSPSSPTPEGRVFVMEVLDTSEAGLSSGAYGPWLLSTSAYSEALDLFDGGLPIIAFHGTGSPGLIGSAVSNGCVRMPNDVITTLAETIPPGTPIDIVA